LGDARRTLRLVRLATASAQRPGGKVTHVCRTSGERQGAYDLLNSKRFGAGAIHSAVVRSTALRCAEQELAFVAVDGTSLSLTDRAGEKDFGSIGARHMGVRGLKFLNAYAIGADGTPLGLLQQFCWKRPTELPEPETAEPKESCHWVSVVENASLLLSAAGATGWFQVDREGDSVALLQALNSSGHFFTARSSHGARRIVGSSNRRRLRHHASRCEVRYWAEIRVPGNAGRRRRLAKVCVRTTSVVLDLVEPSEGKRVELAVDVVDVQRVVFGY